MTAMSGRYGDLPPHGNVGGGLAPPQLCNVAVDFQNSDAYIRYMLSWLLTSVSILIITVIKFVKKRKRLVNVLFIILCLVGLFGAYMAYRDNQRFSEQLGQIDSIEGKVDSLLIVRNNLASEVVNLRRGIDTLIARRDSIGTQIHSLSVQHDSLMAINDSLMKIGKIQLSGELEAILGKSTLIQANVYQKTDIFRSRWPQDLQDISISLQFDNQFERVIAKQGTSGGFLNVTCPSVDTLISSDSLRYSCNFLTKGNWIEIITYSKIPIEIIKTALKP